MGFEGSSLLLLEDLLSLPLWVVRDVDAFNVLDKDGLDKFRSFEEWFSVSKEEMELWVGFRFDRLTLKKGKLGMDAMEQLTSIGREMDDCFSGMKRGKTTCPDVILNRLVIALKGLIVAVKVNQQLADVLEGESLAEKANVQKSLFLKQQQMILRAEFLVDRNARVRSRE